MLVKGDRKRDRGALNDIAWRGDCHRTQGHGSLLSPCFNINGLCRYRLGRARGEIADSHCGGVGAVQGPEVIDMLETREMNSKIPKILLL